MRKSFLYAFALLTAASLYLCTTSCSSDNEPEQNSISEFITDKGDGTLFVLNEGNSQYSNSTLSIYNTHTDTVCNEAFAKVNGMKLGDGAQSMTIADNKGWIVVNNSNVVFAVDPKTCKELGRIENLNSPRYIHFVSDTKAYVTQLWNNRIAIVNPKKYQITGHIEIPDMASASGSSEQMVAYGDYVFCNCWSYQNRIIKIDTRTDEVVDSLIVGVQPRCIALDCNGKLWALTDGGYQGSPAGYEAPALVRIDAETFSIEKKFQFNLGDYTPELCINGKKDTLYWINGDVWKMNVNADALPTESLIKSNGTYYYGLTVAPQSGEVYLADAIDYTQNGIIYRYSTEGNLIGQFPAGVIPGGFCWFKP
ncbi:MAG: glutaminyl-peptide cyclotransferase [Muribaculaceae bacterium]|nr:glutaminyl-peptide cyclotransferase [Muribaculaceae bacterium]